MKKKQTKKPGRTKRKYTRRQKTFAVKIEIQGWQLHMIEAKDLAQAEERADVLRDKIEMEVIADNPNFEWDSCAHPFPIAQLGKRGE